jgi:ferredoxin
VVAKIPSEEDWKQTSIDYTQPDHVPLNLLQLAHHHGVELEGACGGELACSTCHCYLDEDLYETLGELEEEEEDMLDLAYGREEGRSRLGCQVKIDDRISGRTFVIPEDPYG